MCIRCSELGIPAAIGVGNSVYKKIKKSKKKHYWIVLIKRLQRNKMLIGIIPKIKKNRTEYEFSVDLNLINFLYFVFPKSNCEIIYSKRFWQKNRYAYFIWW